MGKPVKKPKGTVSIYLIDKKTREASEPVAIEDLIFRLPKVRFKFPSMKYFVSYNMFIEETDNYEVIVHVDAS